MRDEITAQWTNANGTPGPAVPLSATIHESAIVGDEAASRFYGTNASVRSWLEEIHARSTQ